jgi:hypothetical protein
VLLHVISGESGREGEKEMGDSVLFVENKRKNNKKGKQGRARFFTRVPLFFRAGQLQDKSVLIDSAPSPCLTKAYRGMA